MCVCVLSCFSHVQLFVAPRTAARQAPLSMGFSRQEYWSGLPCPPPGDLPNPGIEPESPVSPALAGRFFTTSVTGEAQYTHTHTYSRCCSVTQSCPTLCNPTDCSMPVFPVLQHLPELARTHTHWVSDAIQPSLICYPLLLLPSTFLSIRGFSNESALCINRPKYWSFEYYEEYVSPL